MVGHAAALTGTTRRPTCGNHQGDTKTTQREPYEVTATTRRKRYEVTPTTRRKRYEVTATTRRNAQSGQNTGMRAVASNQKITLSGPPTRRKSLKRYCPGP